MSIAPYFEAALTMQTSGQTTLNAFTFYDFDGSELGTYGSQRFPAGWALKPTTA